MAASRLDPQRTQEDFFLPSLDRALNAFGANVSIVVYFELRKLFGITREEIPQKLDLFVSTIDRLFGAGSVVVARVIRKELEASSGIKDLSKKDLLTALQTAYSEQFRRLS
jgi:hypothetical protein